MSYHWQKKKEPISHADDWLMTYADMITLLLCFFALFLSLSMPKQEIPKPRPVVAPAQQQDLSPIMEELLERQPVAKELPEPPETIKGNLPFHEPEEGAEKKETAPETPKPSETLPEVVKHLKAQGAASIDQTGDRITTIDISSAAFFDSGSATISNAGKALLKDVAANIKSDQYRDYQVTVEGHTDDSPIKTAQFPSNWELSTARASAVVQFFLEQGIPAERLRAAGYADTFPKVPNRDSGGNPIPQNQSQNRRVVIKLERIERQ